MRKLTNSFTNVLTINLLPGRGSYMSRGKVRIIVNTIMGKIILWSKAF